MFLGHSFYEYLPIFEILSPTFENRSIFTEVTTKKQVDDFLEHGVVTVGLLTLLLSRYQSHCFKRVCTRVHNVKVSRLNAWLHEINYQSEKSIFVKLIV